MKPTLSAALLTALLCLSLALLPGCSASQQLPSAQGQESSQLPSDQPSRSPEQSPAQPGVPPLPGITEDNFPLMDGSTANLPLMASLYSTLCNVPLEQAEATVNISGGTGAVWRNLMNGGAQLLLVYEAPETVKADLEEMGLELEITPLGRDALVFLANAANPVDNLTVEQLQQIYTGQITDWSQVGGEPGPIAAFQRNQESGSQTLFLKLLMQDLTPMTPPTQLVPAEMGALIDGVASYDGSGGALGYSVYFYASQMYADPSLKLLSVDGVAPTNQSIGDGSYPLTNEFYVVIPAGTAPDSPVRLVRDWLLTSQGRQLLVDAGYVPAF